MKSIKRRLAVFLAVLLIVPALPVSAAEPLVSTAATVDAGQPDAGNKPDDSVDKNEDQQDTEKKEEEVPEITPDDTISGTGEELGEIVSPEPVQSPEVTDESEESASPEGSIVPEESASPEVDIIPEESASPTVSASPSATPLLEASEIDEILYNTGNHAWSIVTKEAFDQEMGDGFYEEDGSYTINIPESNPFFPYEVQFTCKGEVTNQWFMTPDDSVEVYGHTFYVSAYFDNTVVTQLSLNVAGDKVIVWPEEKEFTDDGDGVMENSLLPLKRLNLRANLSSYTPAELTMISTGEVFTGSHALTDTDKVVWSRNGDDYAISSSGDKLDLSLNTYSSFSSSWEMIVGEADQLAAENIRYTVNLEITPSNNWLLSTVYIQDDAGERKSIFVGENWYYDYSKDDRYLRIGTSAKEMGEGTQTYVSLNINPSMFSNTKIDFFKFYEGKFVTAAEAMAGMDITEQICCEDMTQANAGYQVERNNWYELTMVTFDANGNVIGCLPFSLYISPTGNYMSFQSMSGRNDNGTYSFVSYRSTSSSANGCINRTVILQDGYPVNGTYYQAMNYYKAGKISSSEVTAAYVGQYSSIAEAVSKGAEDVKGDLFNIDYRNGGYGADYSQGVYFTIFVGEDEMADQEIYCYCIKTVPYEPGEPTLGSGTNVVFQGLKNSKGEWVHHFVTNKDSYGENNYVTILVSNDVDLTNLAPMFSLSNGATLHIDGSSVAEVSGESFHDFSAGPIHYGVSSEDKKNSSNCWLKVLKASSGVGQLYVNSLEDADSNTKVEDGVTYSIREMLLDGYHSYKHDILVINKGEESIPDLNVELVSDVVKLDEYWTLNGNHELAGFSDQDLSKLANLAKLRITAKDGVANGSDVSGTLTFKSGDTVLMVLELTGTVGDPCITTPDIPQAVKYVPYGPLILNNNKYYSWNKVSYYLENGVLPAGMEVKQNGEIYGVPMEAGDFTFTVRMDNSYSSFKSSYKTYSLTVLENTDTNVDNSTDSGYDLSQRVQNVYISASGSPDLSENNRTLVSQGEYSEFKYIFLDGVKLTEGQEYTSESGSTRITIMWQTLLSGNASTPGTHTLGIEFRNGEDEILRKAAQNFVIEKENDNSGNSSDGENSSGGSNLGSSSDGNSNSESTGFESENAGTAAGATGTGDVNTVGGVVGNASVGGQDTAANIGSTVTYIVENGDTLWEIAEKFYGQGSLWQRIYLDNVAVIGSNPDRIYAGQTLIIYLNQGEGSAMSSVLAESTDGMTGSYYTVQEGDTLWKIALKVYGRGWRWRRIYEANEDMIKDPQRIYVGQVLFVPE